MYTQFDIIFVFYEKKNPILWVVIVDKPTSGCIKN